MAGRVRLKAPDAWSALCLLAASGALLTAATGPAAGLDWQAGTAAQQPWRLVTAAWVHWSRLHLIANLAGLALLAWLGRVARADFRCATAWALAWPTTQALLCFVPGLQRYGGLSGVLHAALAVLVVQLLRRERGAARTIGLALGLGLLAKLLGEAPWGPPLRQIPGWDIDVVPAAHALGAWAGGFFGLTLIPRRQPWPAGPPTIAADPAPGSGSGDPR